MNAERGCPGIYDLSHPLPSLHPHLRQPLSSIQPHTIFLVRFQYLPSPVTNSRIPPLLSPPPGPFHPRKVIHAVVAKLGLYSTTSRSLLAGQEIVHSTTRFDQFPSVIYRSAKDVDTWSVRGRPTPQKKIICTKLSAVPLRITAACCSS